MSKKTGYRVVSFDVDKYNDILDEPTTVHIDTNDINQTVHKMFEDNKSLRRLVTYTGPRWNSRVMRAQVWIRKGR